MSKQPLYPHIPKGQGNGKGDISVTVTTTHEIPEQRIKDLLTTALEGGSNYWYRIDSFNYPPGQTEESLRLEFPHLDLPFVKGGSLSISAPGSGEKLRILNRATIEAGMKVFAQKYPKHFADFMAENDDAITGDIFLQTCLYGEQRFA